jgi:hypothetical protein
MLAMHHTTKTLLIVLLDCLVGWVVLSREYGCTSTKRNKASNKLLLPAPVRPTTPIFSRGLIVPIQGGTRPIAFDIENE